MNRILNDTVISASNQTDTFFSDEIQLDYIYGWALRHEITDATTSADTFVDANVTVGTDTITMTAHGLTTGAKGQLTSSGVLPGGLSLATDYFVIVTDANDIQLATSLANAQAGTQVDITTAAGGGTHTFTPASLAGTVTYQASLDGTNWEDLASPAANAFTGSESSLVNQTDVFYNKLRVKVAVTAGTVSVTAIVNGKG